MLSKEDLLLHIQQGTPESDWTVVRPRLSFFLGQIGTWLFLFPLVVVVIISYLGSPDQALVLTGASLDTDSSLQTWRTIDFVIFGLLAVGFLAMLVVQVLDLFAREQQILVLTPQACLIKLRNKEYFVAYANVTSIVPNMQRGGDVKLNISSNDGQITIDLDKRFGKAKDLVSQIIAMHRQAVAVIKN